MTNSTKSSSVRTVYLVAQKDGFELLRFTYLEGRDYKEVMATDSSAALVGTSKIPKQAPKTQDYPDFRGYHTVEPQATGFSLNVSQKYSFSLEVEYGEIVEECRLTNHKYDLMIRNYIQAELKRMCNTVDAQKAKQAKKAKSGKRDAVKQRKANEVKLHHAIHDLNNYYTKLNSCSDCEVASLLSSIQDTQTLVNNLTLELS